MNVLATLRDRFAHALATIGVDAAEIAGPARHGAAQPGREVRRLPGQLRDAAGQAARQAAARDRPAARRDARRGRRLRAAGGRRARASSICGSRTTGSSTQLARRVADVERLGVPPAAEPRTYRRRLFVAQRRQADARRPHPLDRDRRRPLPHPEVPRPPHDQRQPSRRLGHPVRDDHLRLQALRRRSGAAPPSRSTS